MAIIRYPSNTIHHGGPVVRVNDITASQAMLPGHLIERAGGQYRLHVAAGPGPLTLALDSPDNNKGVDDAYALSDLVYAGVLPAGSTGLAWLASGENVTDGAVLESAGGGQFAVHSAGVPLARALEDMDASAGAIRIRVEAI